MNRKNEIEKLIATVIDQDDTIRQLLRQYESLSLRVAALEKHPKFRRGDKVLYNPCIVGWKAVKAEVLAYSGYYPCKGGGVPNNRYIINTANKVFRDVSESSIELFVEPENAEKP